MQEYCGSKLIYYIFAYNSAGESPPSNLLSIDALCLPSPPGELTLESSRAYFTQWAESIAIEYEFRFWHSPSTPEGYYVYDRNDNAEPLLELDSSDIYFTLEWECGVGTQIYIVAWNDAGESAASKYLTTPNTSCEAD